MPVEVANYISDLNVANPLSTDSVAQADDHIRLIKQVIKTTFPNVTGPVTATHTQLSQIIPAGLIAMWSGNTSNVPLGWALCNGQSGTPDLRDRFIVGAGSTYGTNTNGGSLTTAGGGSHSHTALEAGAHTHAGATAGHALTTAQIPSHTHGLYYTVANSYGGGTGAGITAISSASGTNEPNVGSTGSGQAHSHAINSDGAHTHVVSTVVDHTHVATPPYYALAFIMKL
jgi:microcystin-dependent protein